MKRETLKRLVKFLLRTLTNTCFAGVEYIPPKGGMLFVTNHMSRIDIPVLFMNPVRPDIIALITTKYQKYVLFRWFAETAGGIWLNRETADFAAFRKAYEALDKGTALGIAPEGTRSSTGQLLQAKPGAVLLASKANVPIVPVALMGTESASKGLLLMQNPHIEARFGPAFHLPEISREDRETEMNYWTDEIMCRIAMLMPEKYHGFYRGHPRIAELRKELQLPLEGYPTIKA